MGQIHRGGSCRCDPIGFVSGFVRWVDGIIMRVMNGLMSIPPILLAVAPMALPISS
jgi:ABC-type dipeptide/oligopeptide/nickel transport system permease subunit